MLVKCDKCGQGYEVNETRISSQGAKIKCPSCANIFLVHLNNGVATVSSDDSGAGAQTDVDKKPAEKEDSWRVRHMGLTYTFHDISSLQDWFSGRPSLDDVKVAHNEDDWKELGDYPNILTAELITKFFPLGDVPTTGSKKQSASSSNTGEKKTIPGAGIDPNSMHIDPSQDPRNIRRIAKAKRDEQKRLEEEKKSLKTRIITLSVVFLVVVIGVGIYVWVQKGIIDVPNALQTIENTENTNTGNQKTEEPKTDFKDVLKTDPNAVQDRGDNAEVNPDAGFKVLSDEEIRQQAEAELQNRLNEASDMVKKKLWPEARATLETIVRDQPDNLQALQLLQQTYRGLNLDKQASELDAQIKKAKAKAAEDAKKKAETAAPAEDALAGGDWVE